MSLSNMAASFYELILLSLFEIKGMYKDMPVFEPNHTSMQNMSAFHSDHIDVESLWM